MTEEDRKIELVVNHEIKHVVAAITRAANEQGLKVTEGDVGWIISVFIEAVFTGDPIDQTLSSMMQQLADDCAAVGECRSVRPS